MDNQYQEEINKGTRFAFGQNWKNFLETLDDEVLVKAAKDIREWTGLESFTGKRVIDIGSGSGVHSYAFHTMGAAELLSFDYDNNSVEATKRMLEKAGSPQNWKVMQGSALDSNFTSSLGKFDMVYSWGVLHHTGNMWDAINNAVMAVAPGGLLWIAIYQKGPQFQADLKLKQRYNSASPMGKKMMEWTWISKLMAKRVLAGKNPFTWNEKVERGMNVYHDIIDWLGGLPYEVADQKEITLFCEQRGLVFIKANVVNEGGCSSYLFKKA